MTYNFLGHWQKLSKEDQLIIFEETAKKISLQASIIEKDWWVSLTLRIVFGMEIASHLVFKGGTSLSKGWHLIERFSEDIDLALDRSYLGFDGELSKSAVRRLRKASQKHIKDSFLPNLEAAFAALAIPGVEFKLSPVTASDQDPIIVEIHYPTITRPDEYVEPRVLLEIGSRSLRQPFTSRPIYSMAGAQYAGNEFADSGIEIPCVNPERTFLEKIFLLHEEFQKPAEKIRVARLSRHLYDIQKIMASAHGEKAISDKELYNTIVAHRRNITPIRGINYDLHKPESIKIIPPATILSAWSADYKSMQNSMIYGSSLGFKELMAEIESLQRRINSLKR